MAKAISGEGSIRRRLSGKLAGKWRVQWSYDDPMSNELTTVDRTFPTQAEAARFLKELKVRVHTGQKIEVANAKRALTLNTWFDELAGTSANGFAGRWQEDGMKLKTISTKVSRYNTHVRNSEVGKLPVQHIDIDRARAFFRTMKEEGKSKATMKDVQGVLVKVLNDAIDTYEKLPNLRNPFSKVKLETPEVREAIVVTPKDAMQAVRKLSNEEDRAFLGLFFLAGLRLSEHMAITAEQIDFDKGVIVIDRAVKLGPTGKQDLGLPKGDKVRLVTMCPTLAELLRPLVEKTDSYLFPAKSVDSPRMKKRTYENWHRILKETGLPEELEPRDCRLSHNTWLEKFCPKVSLSTRLEHMGHSVNRNSSEHRGLTVNLRNYTRFLSDAQGILRKELERVVKAALRKGR
ncbi:phage integrase family protein [Candidatus Nitrosymbiomonas proteolyticus]|uniref:Phage integrase family protein n=1 Tax=Candidatus Nitrosymbiomonas proteolyticus TaxID=2608984 RepID=A0A809RTV1_9BACT|nr:phage integrase family protein [Candidatus Nitrosymbiomonas proteolyticus]